VHPTDQDLCGRRMDLHPTICAPPVSSHALVLFTLASPNMRHDSSVRGSCNCLERMRNRAFCAVPHGQDPTYLHGSPQPKSYSVKLQRRFQVFALETEESTLNERSYVYPVFLSALIDLIIYTERF